MDLKSVGIWTGQLDYQPASRAREAVAELEELGYGAVWVGEAVGREVLSNARLLLGAPRRLIVATGIANIWVRDALAMVAGQYTLAEAYPEGFLLGRGGRHAPLIEGMRGHQYQRPLAAMGHYLQAMDEVVTAYRAVPPATPPPRVLAALGPKMLALAAERAQGAHTYFVPPEHTAQARDQLGPGLWLIPEQAVVLENDPEQARELARRHTSRYLRLPSTPAALGVRVGGSVRASRGPDGVGATVTRPARSPAGLAPTTPAPPAAGEPREPSGGPGRARRSGRRGPLCALGAGGLGAGDGQERMGQQGQGDVAIPARPLADLVVVQADLALSLLKALLHRPPSPGHPHQPDQRRGCRPVAGVEGQLAVTAAAADQQPPGHADGSRGGKLHAGPVIQPAALGTVPGAASDPLLGRHRSGQLRSAGARPGRSVNSLDLKRLGALDRQHVPHATALQPAPQGRATAIDLIGGHPRRRHPSVQRTLQHALGELWLGPEPDLLGDPRRSAPLRVV